MHDAYIAESLSTPNHLRYLFKASVLEQVYSTCIAHMCGLPDGFCYGQGRDWHQTLFSPASLIGQPCVIPNGMMVDQMVPDYEPNTTVDQRF